MRNPESKTYAPIAAVAALATAMAGAGCSPTAYPTNPLTPDAGHVDPMTERIKTNLDSLQAAEADLEKIKSGLRARLGLGAMGNHDGCFVESFERHFCISCAAGRRNTAPYSVEVKADGDAIRMLRQEVPDMQNGDWVVVTVSEGNEDTGKVACARATYTGGALDHPEKTE